jgi:hypothetical protein
MTLNEIRERRGLKPLEKGGDLIFNQIYYQSQMAQQQQGMGQGGEDFGQGQDSGFEENNPFLSETDDDNPFLKEMNTDFNQMQN